MDDWSAPNLRSGQMPEIPRLLTIPEVANHLRMSKAQVYRLCETRRLRPIRPSGPRGKMYIVEGEVLDFLRRSGSSTEAA